jgi:hypothetical protein
VQRDGSPIFFPQWFITAAGSWMGLTVNCELQQEQEQSGEQSSQWACELSGAD